MNKIQILKWKLWTETDVMEDTSNTKMGPQGLPRKQFACICLQVGEDPSSTVHSSSNVGSVCIK